jgi:hypothetical protein
VVGSRVGSCVGLRVGKNVVGDKLGFLVGKAEGYCVVGKLVGNLVGSLVGFSVLRDTFAQIKSKLSHLRLPLASILKKFVRVPT